MAKIPRYTPAAFFGKYLDVDREDNKMTLLDSSKMSLRREVSLMTKYFILRLAQIDMEEKDRAKLSMAVHLVLDKSYSMRKVKERLGLNTSQVFVLTDLFPKNFFRDLNKLKKLIAKAKHE